MSAAADLELDLRRTLGGLLYPSSRSILAPAEFDELLDVVNLLGHFVGVGGVSDVGDFAVNSSVVAVVLASRSLQVY